MSAPVDDRGDDASREATITADDWPAWRALRSSKEADPNGAPRQLKLGRYLLEHELGRGATGCVFRALDVERNLPVAIKLLSRVTSQRLVAFKSEFRIAASVSHPNLVTPFELAAGDHGWFIAMELVEGVHFLDHVRPNLQSIDRPSLGFDLTRLRQGLLEVVSGLEALHAAGYLHRDLKPSNVLVGADGRSRIADLGLAILKETDRGPGEGKRMVVGSPAYMAPEQVEGAVLTPAADLYALGVMCFEAMTGALPFDGPVHSVVLNKTLRDAPDPRTLIVDLPEDLVRLTTALLSRLPHARPSLSMVRAVLVGEAVRDQPTAEQRSSRPIVGRTRELQALDAALSMGEQGSATVVHLTGSSGVGKSALLRAFCGHASERGGWVLAGRCHELESIPRKGLDQVIDALHEHLAMLPEMTRALWIPESLPHAVPLFPPLADFVPAGVVINTQDLSAAERTLKAHDAVIDLIVSVAQRTRVAIVIDDVQWSDHAGARLLEDLVAGPRSVPVVVVLAYRTQEAHGSPMVQALAARRPGQWTYREHRIEVTPLGTNDCVDLALSLLAEPDRALAERIAVESRGEPFLIEQLSLHGAAQLHQEGEIDDVIGARSAALPDLDRRLLDTIALAGQPIPERLAALACGHTDLRGALAHLTAISLLRRTGSGPDALVYAYHDRVRVALAQRVAEPQRVAIHLALAQHGEIEGLLLPRALSDQLARAGERERAAVFALRAAEDAEAALAFDAAVDSYAQALELAGARIDIVNAALVGRARALFQAGRCAEAGDAYVRAAQEAEQSDRDLLKLRAVEALLVSGRIDRARVQLEPLLSSCGARYPSTTGAVLRGLVRGAVMTRLRCRKPPAVMKATDAAAARRSDVLWAAGKGLIAVSPGHGAVLAYDALIEALRSGDAHRIARGLTVVGSGVVPFVEGVSETYLSWASDVATRLDDDHLRLMVLVGETCRATTAGAWALAIETAGRALSLAPRVKAPTAWEESVVHTLLGSAYEYQGDLAQMERASEACLREFRARGDAITEVIVVSAYGYTRAAAHDASAVESAILAMGTHIPRWGLGFGQWDFYKTRLEVLRALCWNDAERAASLLNAAWPEIEKNHLLQMPFVRGPALALRSAVLHERLIRDRYSRALAREATKNQGLLRGERRADGPVNGMLSEAALAHAQGMSAIRDARLRHAIEHARRADLGVVMRTAQLVYACLHDDRASRQRLVQELADRGVADAAAWTRYVAPGLADTLLL